MAQTGKKKSVRASKTKISALQPVAPQKSILDLLVKAVQPAPILPNGNVQVASGHGPDQGIIEVSSSSSSLAQGEHEVDRPTCGTSLVISAQEPDINGGPAADSKPMVLLPESIPTANSTQIFPHNHSLPPRAPLQRSVSSNGGTRHNPIMLLDSSPTKPNPRTQTDLTKPAYSIFAPRKQASITSPLLTGKPKLTDKAQETPYPDAESQHVRGAQSQFISAPLQLGRRLTTDPAADPQLPTELSFLLHQSPMSAMHVTSTNDPLLRSQSASNALADEHARTYPAIAHVLKGSASSSLVPSSQETWCDKWRPKRAEHVLGNEKEATYLREWLRALELQLQPGDSPPPLAEGSSSSKRSSTSTSLSVVGIPDMKEVGESKKGRVKRPRPQVVRAVEKQRGRKKQRLDSEDEDHWIVDDDFAMLEEQGTDDEEDDLNIGPRKKLSRLRRIESSPAPTPASSPPPPPPTDTISSYASGVSFDSDLHNTLLLAGPVGSGKTAAVYACAHELGWDVFEVHPGTGKRSGVCIDQLIGEVGKNHMVGKASATSKTKPKVTEGGGKAAFMNMFTKGRGNTPSDHVVDGTLVEDPMGTSDNAPPSGGHFGFMVQPEAQDVVESTTVRQSLILLEEVDILYEEDRGFWPAIINLIKDCKRPVILTCNDISLVPVADLPLQDVLHFEPCAPAIVTSYLQAICLAENRPVDRRHLTELSGSTQTVDLVDTPDIPLNPLTGSLPGTDLRAAIHQLQLLSSTPLYSSTRVRTVHECREDLADWSTIQLPTYAQDGPDSSALLRRMERHVDAVSYVDSFLTRNPLGSVEALASNDHSPCPDDEVGHTHLFNCSVVPGALASYYADETILEDVLQHSRGALEATHPEPRLKESNIALQTRALFRARGQYQSEMLDLLWPNIIPLQSQLLPRPSVFLEYVPFIRHMARIDDDFEKNGGWDSSINPRSGRLVRASVRAPYERQLTLSDRQRDIISNTRLDGFGGD